MVKECLGSEIASSCKLLKVGVTGAAIGKCGGTSRGGTLTINSVFQGVSVKKL